MLGLVFFQPHNTFLYFEDERDKFRKTHLLMKLIAWILPFTILFQSQAQSIATDIVTKPWSASWITVPEESEHDYGVYNFRKLVDLPQKPDSFVIHVSADNRYKLFVNGNLVSLGPARGDLFHWQFETVDIAKHLMAGRNVISAIVWNFGSYKPEAQISLRTAFIVQGNTPTDQIINTGKSWRCRRDPMYQPRKPELVYSYYVAGPGEQIDFNQTDGDWTASEYNDKAWKDALTLFNGLPKGVFDWSTGWMLVPRAIPAMEITKERLKSVRLSTGLTLSKNFPGNTQAVVVPPSAKVKLLLDQEHLTNAYPDVIFSKGKNAVITLSYAESLYRIENTNDWRSERQKGNRNEIAGKRFVGANDQLISNGRDHQHFTSLSWRTYRYLQLEIETKDEALTIDDISGFFTGFPFELKADFETKDAVLDQIMATGWRTARLCAVETYMDCPYYEQLQYVGDTRIQALVSLFNSGDDRLVKNAIDQLDHSRMAEGITLSRYPTANAQQIPTFSLWWIGMLHDYWRYGKDEEFVRSKLPGLRLVLNFFKGYQLPDGSLKDAPYWEFTDWAEGTGWNHGVAPIGQDGSSAVLDLQLCWAYELAAELERRLGMEAFAVEYDRASALLRQTIQNKYWNPERQLFADTSEKNTFSQHPNALAIMTDVITGSEANQLMERILTRKDITQATIYFKYYVHQALAKTGQGDRYLNLLDDWREQLNNGLTTWAEISDHNMARSDCHAWGASPNIEFFRIVLGIDSDAPGFSKVKIAPHLGTLTHVAGKMPHPNGEILVQYTFVKNKWKIMITLPRDVEGRFQWKGKETVLKSGINQFEM
jgi:alpha-L-rhamnosidase